MDDAERILDYLPLSYGSTEEGAYIEHLWSAFSSNYQSGYYQFAMLALHMLFMSHVYFTVWQIRLSRPKDLAKILTFHRQGDELLKASSPYGFNRSSERDIIKLLKLLGCPAQHLGQFARLVTERNSIAHPNGHIFYGDVQSAGRKVNEIVANLEILHVFRKPLIQDCMRQFLICSQKPDQLIYMDESDQIREVLIHRLYLSSHDIRTCLAFDISSLSRHKDFSEMKRLHRYFVDIYGDTSSSL
jgi:hypothetical protein